MMATSSSKLLDFAPEIIYNIFSFLSYSDVYHVRSVCQKFHVMGELHIYQQIKYLGQTITLKLDKSKNISLELFASHYDTQNRVIEFRPMAKSRCSVSLANTCSNHWSAYHRLLKIYFSGWFSNSNSTTNKMLPNIEQLSHQDQALFLYHQQYNSSIEKTYELPSWNNNEFGSGVTRYLGDKGFIMAMSYSSHDMEHQQEMFNDYANSAPALTNLPTSYYSYRSAASTIPMPTAPSLNIKYIRVTLDWVLAGLNPKIPSTQIYESSFSNLSELLAKEGCFKYDLLSEPVLNYIIYNTQHGATGKEKVSLSATQQLPDSLIKYVHSHTHECQTRLSRLQHMLEGAGVDAQVLWKYTFAKSFVVGNGSLLGEEDVIRRIQDSEEEWRQKKLSLSRKLFNGNSRSAILI